MAAYFKHKVALKYKRIRVKRELRLRYLLFRLSLARRGSTVEIRHHRMLSNALNFSLATLTLYQQQAPVAAQGPTASKAVLGQFLQEWDYRLTLKNKMMRIITIMDNTKLKFKAVVLQQEKAKKLVKELFDKEISEIRAAAVKAERQKRSASVEITEFWSKLKDVGNLEKPDPDNPMRQRVQRVIDQYLASCREAHAIQYFEFRDKQIADQEKQDSFAAVYERVVKECSPSEIAFERAQRQESHLEAKIEYRRLVQEASRFLGSKKAKFQDLEMQYSHADSHFKPDFSAESMQHVLQLKSKFAEMKTNAFGDLRTTATPEDPDLEAVTIYSFKDLKWQDPFPKARTEAKRLPTARDPKRQPATTCFLNCPRFAYIPSKLLVRKMLRVCCSIERFEEFYFFF